MSTFYAATEIDALAAKLAENIAAETAGGDPLRPVTLLAPNRNLKKWLQLRLARALGIAINLKFDYLETGLWEALQELDSNAARPKLLTNDALQLAILATLLDENELPGELRPLRNYLGDAHGSARQNFCRKAWQLSGRLARLFRDYEYHRAEMIENWPASRKPPADAMEACQHALWRAVMAKFAELPERRLTLPQYARAVLPSPRVRGEGSGERGRTIHLFGVSQISPFHTELLRDLSSALDLRVYHLNALLGPLEESDERETQRREFLAAAKKDTSTTDLNAQFGAAGRSSLFLFSSLLKEDRFAFEFVPQNQKPETRNPKPGVLSRLQQSILCVSASLREPTPQDTSIQILACPGVFREVETVYHSIIHNLRLDPALKLTDIAVLVTDMAAYRPALQSVFGREPQAVPYNLTDFSTADHSVFGQGLLALLELAASPFTRSKAFACVMNPCFLAAAGRERDEALVWLRWAEALNIYHSFDRAEKSARGYADNALYTWQQGLQRLRLGRIMEFAESSRAGTPVPQAYAGVLPFADGETSGRELLAGFCATIESLQQRLRELRELKAGAKVWREKIAALIGDFLAVPDDRPEEEQVRRSILAALSNLKTWDALTPLAPPGRGVGGEGFELALIREFLAENLAGLDSTVGSYLTGGVTISALQPMRPIPFEIVYMLGLGEGQFPGREAASALDLTARETRPGDIGVPAANRYLFLEALLATRRKLYLSYVAHDLQKFQTLYPSSVLNVLRRELETQTGSAFNVLDVPLHGSDARYLAPLPCPSPQRGEGLEERGGVSDALVNYSVPERLVCLLDSSVQLTPAQQNEVAAREKALRPDFAAHAAAPENLPETEFIALKELKAFLRNPAEGAARRHLRMYDDEEPAEARDDEPFFTEDARELVLSTLHDFVVRAAKGQPADWRETFQRAYEAARLCSAAPDGAFEQLDRERLQHEIEARLAPLAAFTAARKHLDFQETVVIASPLAPRQRGEGLGVRGGATDGQPLAMGSVEFPLLDGRRAQLSGALPLVWREKDVVETLAIALGNKPGAPKKLSPVQLEPFLFYLAARRALGASELRLHVAGARQIAQFTYKIAPAAALEYLQMLIADFLDRKSFDVLPLALIAEKPALQTAFTAPPGIAAEAYADLLREIIDEDQSGPRPLYRPMQWLSLVAARVPADALEKVRRRLGPLIAGTEK